MPQMAPLMWFSLFIMSSIMFFMFNQMNFFSFKPKLIKNKMMNIKSKNMNWKW